MSWIRQCGHDLMFSCCKRIPQPHPPKHLAVVFILLILIFKNCHLPSITCGSVQLNILLLPSLDTKHLLNVSKRDRALLL